MTVPAGTVRTGGTLEYCRMNGITIQSWSTLQYGFFEGTFLGNREMYPELNEKLESIAAKYRVLGRLSSVRQNRQGSGSLRKQAASHSRTANGMSFTGARETGCPEGYSLKIISAGGFQAVNRINKGLHSETRSIPTGR